MSAFMPLAATANGSINGSSINVCYDVSSAHLLQPLCMTSQEGQFQSRSGDCEGSHHCHAENSPRSATTLFFEVKHSTPLPRSRSSKSHARHHSSQATVDSAATVDHKARRRHSYSDAGSNSSTRFATCSSSSLGSTIYSSRVFVDADADDAATKIFYGLPQEGRTKRHWKSDELALATAAINDSSLLDEEAYRLRVKFRAIALRLMSALSKGLLDGESSGKYDEQQPTHQSAGWQQRLSRLSDEPLTRGDETESDLRQLPTDWRQDSNGGNVDAEAVDGLRYIY